MWYKKHDRYLLIGYHGYIERNKKGTIDIFFPNIHEEDVSLTIEQAKRVVELHIKRAFSEIHESQDDFIYPTTLSFKKYTGVLHYGPPPICGLFPNPEFEKLNQDLVQQELYLDFIISEEFNEKITMKVPNKETAKGLFLILALTDLNKDIKL